MAEFWDSVRGSGVLMGAMEGGIGLLRSQEDEDGKIFSMQRETRSAVIHYGFDFGTLMIHEADPPTKVKIAPADQIIDAILRHGPRTIMQILVVTGGSEPTIRHRLEALMAEDRVTRDREHGNGPWRYDVSPAEREHREDAEEAVEHPAEQLELGAA